MKPNAARIAQSDGGRRHGQASAEGVSVDRRTIFRARCEARALLFAAGEISLHDAVDGLQYDAEATGLVDELGRDEVQRIMGGAFAAVRPELGAAGSALKPVDVVPDMPLPKTDLPDRHDEMLVGALWDALNRPERHGVASSTLQAAEYLVRQNDPKEFEAWLLRHSSAERTEIVAHFNKRRRP
jgi:hypothetical protein